MAGIPSFSTYPMAPPGKVTPGVAASGGGWWHTKYDKLDKVDLKALLKETRYTS